MPNYATELNVKSKQLDENFCSELIKRGWSAMAIENFEKNILFCPEGMKNGCSTINPKTGKIVFQ
jgi:hypothetical protein